MILSFRNKTPDIPKSSYVSESVDIIGDVILGENTNIWFGTVIRGDMNYIRIGSGTNIQDNSTIHVTTKTAPTIIGSNVTIGHNALIHGCTIEDNCLIGMGSIIMDKAVIGAGSIIGAGALVVPGTIVPEGSLFIGQPARMAREVTEAEYANILRSADHYIEYAREFKNMENDK